MWKRSRFSHETALPEHITPDAAVNLLHRHDELIRLNPLVVDFKRCPMPDQAPEAESDFLWYELTDRITYFPGITRNVKYHAGFQDLPDGLRTHVFAPAGLEIRETWTIRHVIGNYGLTLCEDVDMSCNILLTAFVKKNLDSSHATLTAKLIEADSSTEMPPSSLLAT